MYKYIIIKHIKSKKIISFFVFSRLRNLSETLTLLY